MIEMHGVLRTALAHGPQSVDVAEHVRERNHRVHDPRIAALIHAGHLSATAVQVADDVAHILVRRDALDPHDRLEQERLRSEEHTSELQSLMRSSYAVFCLKKTQTAQHYI